MKKLLALAAVSLFVGIAPITLRGSRDGNANNENIRDRFVGAWGLAWLEQEGADGSTIGRFNLEGRGPGFIHFNYRGVLGYEIH